MNHAFTPNGIKPGDMSNTQRKRLKRLNKQARPIANRGGVSPMVGKMMIRAAMLGNIQQPGSERFAGQPEPITEGEQS